MYRIGGGDQIYNDGIRVSGPLKEWSNIANPKKRKDHPFPESLRQECDDYYLKNYLRWYVSFSLPILLPSLTGVCAQVLDRALCARQWPDPAAEYLG